jgi:hypothetical protein
MWFVLFMNAYNPNKFIISYISVRLALYPGNMLFSSQIYPWHTPDQVTCFWAIISAKSYSAQPWLIFIQSRSRLLRLT